jgi:hypothetical protein
VGESSGHTDLVRSLYRWISKEFAHEDSGLALFADLPDLDLQRKPIRIGGFVPDIYAVTFPRSFTLLGEAKWFRDLETPHTERQFKAFFEFLEQEKDPHFVVASPPALVGTAIRVAHTAMCGVGATRTRLYYLDPFGKVVSLAPAR